MKKSRLFIALVLAFSVSICFSQSPQSGDVALIRSGDSVVYGFFVGPSTIVAPYRQIGKMKTAVFSLAGSTVTHEIQGFVSSMEDHNLVLLKTDYDSARAFEIAPSAPAPGDYLFLAEMTNDGRHVLGSRKFIEIKNYGNFSLLQVSGLLPAGNRGLPLLDSNGRVVAMSVEPPVEGGDIGYAVPCHDILKLVSTAGTLKKLELLAPTFEKIDPDAHQTEQEKNKIVQDYLDQGNLKLYAKDYKGAAEKFSMAIKINPNDADAYVFRGQARIYLLQYKDAIDDFNKAIDLEPGYAEAWDLRGICKAELGDRKAACEDWQKAFELGFDHAFKLLKEFCDIDKMK